MNLEAILTEWKKDSQIEMMALDASSVEASKNHGKYLELHATYKLKLKDAEFKQKELMKWKYLYYEGKMSKDEIDRFGGIMIRTKVAVQPLTSSKNSSSRLTKTL